MKHAIWKTMLFFQAAILASSPVTQDRQTVIEEIVVMGHSRMSAAAVLRVMGLRVGEPVGPDKINEARSRLEALGVFRYVSIEEKTGERGLLLVVSLRDKSLVFANPQINLGGSTGIIFSEEDEKSSYGLEAGLRDFSGNNHHLLIDGGYGDLKRIGLRYEKKYFSGVFLGADLRNLWYESRIYDTGITKILGSIFGGIRKSRWEVSLWTRYDRVRFKTEPKSRPAEEFIKVGLLLAYDVRDWDVFPTRGFLSRAGVWQIWEKGGGRLYNRYTAECSFFHNLWSDHVLALDTAVSVSTGKVPLYDRLYFGGQRTLRGIPVGSHDGTQSAVVSCEYRMPISRFQKNRIEASPQGAVVYFFLDAGTIADSMPELRRKEIIVNPGAGLFWILTPEGGLKLDLSVHPRFRLTASSVWRF